MAEQITGSEQFIDTRNIIERIAELEAIEVIDREPDEQDELDALSEFEEEYGPQIADYQHGETLIEDSYFEEYAEEMAYDIGAISREAGWPANHIDWEAAAEELKQDYTEVELFGNTYWAR
jgi:hypothetical protein